MSAPPQLWAPPAKTSSVPSATHSTTAFLAKRSPGDDEEVGSFSPAASPRAMTRATLRGDPNALSSPRHLLPTSPRPPLALKSPTPPHHQRDPSLPSYSPPASPRRKRLLKDQLRRERETREAVRTLHERQVVDHFKQRLADMFGSADIRPADALRMARQKQRRADMDSRLRREQLLGRGRPTAGHSSSSANAAPSPEPPVFTTAVVPPLKLLPSIPSARGGGALTSRPVPASSAALPALVPRQNGPSSMARDATAFTASPSSVFVPPAAASVVGAKGYITQRMAQIRADPQATEYLATTKPVSPWPAARERHAEYVEARGTAAQKEAHFHQTAAEHERHVSLVRNRRIQQLLADRSEAREEHTMTVAKLSLADETRRKLQHAGRLKNVWLSILFAVHAMQQLGTVVRRHRHIATLQQTEGREKWRACRTAIIAGHWKSRARMLREFRSLRQKNPVLEKGVASVVNRVRGQLYGPALRVIVTVLRGVGRARGTVVALRRYLRAVRCVQRYVRRYITRRRILLAAMASAWERAVRERMLKTVSLNPDQVRIASTGSLRVKMLQTLMSGGASSLLLTVVDQLRRLRTHPVLRSMTATYAAAPPPAAATVGRVTPQAVPTVGGPAADPHRKMPIDSLLQRQTPPPPPAQPAVELPAAVEKQVRDAALLCFVPLSYRLRVLQVALTQLTVQFHRRLTHDEAMEGAASLLPAAARGRRLQEPTTSGGGNGETDAPQSPRTAARRIVADSTQYAARQRVLRFLCSRQTMCRLVACVEREVWLHNTRLLVTRSAPDVFDESGIMSSGFTPRNPPTAAVHRAGPTGSHRGRDNEGDDDLLALVPTDTFVFDPPTSLSGSTENLQREERFRDLLDAFTRGHRPAVMLTDLILPSDAPNQLVDSAASDLSTWMTETEAPPQGLQSTAPHSSVPADLGYVLRFCERY